MINETLSPDINDNEFARLLDEYTYSVPERGEILEGTILEVNDDEVLVDVGLKRDAVVTRKDLSLLDESVIDNLEEGQSIMLYVLQPRNSDGELIVSINKALELEDWQEAQRLSDSGELVEAEVIFSNRGGVMVKVNRLTGFVPQSHLVSLPRFASQYELEEAKKQLLGKKLAMKFIEIDRRRNRLILSERLAQADVQQARMSELEVGQRVTGRVVSIVNFGAFVDLGGVDGLIHISKLAHSHVNHPGEVLSVGDEVEVLIDGIDAEKSRISLDRAALLPDPWHSVTDEFSIGDLVECTVTNVVDFGVFAQLPNGLQGLIHISEMTMFGTQNPHDVLRDGDTVLARIISIEPEEHRIALSIDKVEVREQEEWMHERREGDDEVLDEEEDLDDGADVIIEDELDDVPEASVEDDIEEEDDVVETDEAETAEAQDTEEETEPTPKENEVETSL